MGEEESSEKYSENSDQSHENTRKEDSSLHQEVVSEKPTNVGSSEDDEPVQILKKSKSTTKKAKTLKKPTKKVVQKPRESIGIVEQMEELSDKKSSTESSEELAKEPPKKTASKNVRKKKFIKV